MRTILHILTRSEDELVREIIRAQQSLPQVTVVVVDLTKTEPDYNELVDRIFAAGSVGVW